MAEMSNPLATGHDLDDIDDILRPLLPNDGHNIQGSSLGQPFFSVQPIKEQEIQINVLDLKDIYDKIQKKTANGSEQRIANAVVNIEVITSAQISKINVYVRRCEHAADKTNDTTGPILLPVTIQSSFDKILLTLNLDSVYKTQSGSFVYWLDRVEVEERNVWELIIITEFIDGTQNFAHSKPFRIRTKPRPPAKQNPEPSPESQGGESEQDPLLPPGQKRKRASPSTSSYGTNASPYSAFSNSPGNFIGDAGYNGSSPSSGRTSEVVVTDYLEAQRAQIQHLRVQKMISSPNADIAYHLQLQGPYYRKDSMEEGDVVGFFENKENGQTEIALLSMDNAQDARMAGVISRSAYLHGNVPAENVDKTDTVCVIGIVGIKISGPVQNGERIYASADKPGIGIPETQIPLRAVGKVSPILLGQSLQAANSSNLDTVHRVKCFVSVVLGIQSGQMFSALEDVRRDTRKRIADSILREKKKFYRGLLWKCALVLILLAIITAVLYEVLAPGSWLRYALCRRGSIEHHDAWFSYQTSDWQTPRVHGIEFTWEKLKKKMGLRFDKYNGTGMHYYLNIDRCAYGGLVAVRSSLDNRPQVRGPEIFAMNFNCSHAYYEMDAKWYIYVSGRRYKCIPPGQ